MVGSITVRFPEAIRSRCSGPAGRAHSTTTLVAVGLLLGLLPALLNSKNAVAEDACEPDNGLSPCVDASNYWWATGNAKFAVLESPRVLQNGSYTVGGGLAYVKSSIKLDALSADPPQQQIDLVDQRLDASVLLAMGVGHRLELSSALEFVAHQQGSIPGATPESAPSELQRAAVRDPRLGVAVQLHASGTPQQGHASKARLVVQLPLGDRRLQAGSKSATLAPSLDAGLDLSRFFVHGSLGLRLTESVELAGVRIGNAAWVALGVGYDLLGQQRLVLGAEAWALPSLLTQPTPTFADGNRVINVVHIPAEWLASVRSQPVPPLTLLAGFGAGLPVSTETVADSGGAEHRDFFAAATAPRYRAVFQARVSAL